MLCVNTPVKVTVLGPSTEPALSGIVLHMEGIGLRIWMRLPVPCGTPVKVETDERLMLAEVCRCMAIAGGFEASLIVSEMLSGLSELRRLNRALLEESRS